MPISSVAEAWLFALQGLMVAHSVRSFIRVFKYSKRHRAAFYWGCFFSFWKKIFDVAPEILIGVAIDVVVNRENSFLARLGVDSPVKQLIDLTALTLVVWILESLAEYALLIKWKGFAQDLQHDFRVDAYDHLQRLDMSYLEDRSTGDLVSVLNDDVNQLERFFNEGMNNLIQIFTSTAVIGAVFFALSPFVAVFTFIPMPIIFFSAIYFQKLAGPLYMEMRERAGSLGARLSNNISGLATIRSFTAEAVENERVRTDSIRYAEANFRAIAVSARFNPLIRMGVLLGFLSAFVVGGVLTLRGHMSVGVYGVLVFLTQRLLWPLRDLAATVDLFVRAMASADRVLDLMAVPVHLEQSQPTSPAAVANAFNPALGIELEKVSFSYKNQVPVLRGIDLAVSAGKTVALVGPTGSGKSTITKLLLRYYAPTAGRIRVGGLDVMTCDPRVLRRHIGLVSQDTFLFQGTIYENIVYGRPGASRAEVWEAARRAYADEFIEKLPQGLDTVIGERGQKLSGGQRQRLSIARVILKDPPVLILDEATSSVDNETEAVIQKSLAEVAKGRTTLIIAHRLSTIVHADKIYVLADGQIAEEGTHETLLKQNGVYSHLWMVRPTAAHV